MKVISYLLLFSMVYYISCSSTHMIKHDQSNYNELNNELEGKEFSLTLINGRFYAGKDITVEKHFASWVVDTTKYFAPTSEVKKITVMSSSLGMTRGMGYGFLFGASIGTIFGIIVISDMSEDTGYSKAGIVGGAAALGGIACAIIGLPIGLASPGEMEYIFTDSTTAE